VTEGRPAAHLAIRDQHRIDRAACVDCDWNYLGRDARRRGGSHALRRKHRVAFTRTIAAELRPRRWPG